MVDSDAALSRNLAENVELPAIFRTLDQGAVPGIILSYCDDGMLILPGYSMFMVNDTIVIAFAPTALINLSVTLTKSDPGGTAIRIPGTEWYLEASTQRGE